MKTTTQRLAKYRAQAEKTKISRPDWTAAHDWRYWKTSVLWSTPNNVRRDGKLFSDSLEQIGPVMGDASDIVRLRHTGWWGHWSGSHDLIKGAVVKMRTPRGTYYVPATYCEDFDGTTHHLGDAEFVAKGMTEDDHWESICEAARRADEFARLEAEDMREDSMKQDAELRASELRYEASEARNEARELIRAIREQGNQHPTICLRLRRDVRELVTKARELTRKALALDENPYLVTE